MAKPSDIHDNIHAFSSILHTQVCETDAQIKALWNYAKLLARGHDLGGQAEVATTDQDRDQYQDQYQKENEDQSQDETERRVILELEQARLNLVMEIQEETYITQKLTEMVGECEELTAGVSTFYRSRQEDELREKRALEEYTKTISDSSIHSVTESLQQNIRRIAAFQSSLYLNAKKILDTIQHEDAEMLRPEAQQRLSLVIDQLNAKFDLLVAKSKHSD